jgi:pyruvate/2-oxoglutarate dehydrogenase complex dihydrolipoamide acyltransferase (E2) component
VSRKLKITGWRKITTATWGHPNDPQIFGDVHVDAEPILSFIREARDKVDVKLTVTHMVGKALAHALSENPDLNIRLYRNRFIQRETVDVFFIVSAGGGDDLSGVKVERADEKAVVDIARELAARARRIREEEDVEFGKTKRMLSRTPVRLLGWSLRLAAWLAQDLDLDLKKYGLPRQAFGSVMVSSVGMFGIEHAYAPLSPYYRVPFLVLVGGVTERPAVVDGEVVARPMFTITGTLDHRYLDGFHAARIMRSVQEYLADPRKFEPGL